MSELKEFREMGLSEETLKALEKKGFEEPTPIQKKTIPVLLKGEKDLIAQAQTGTGKTAAFGLPLIERLKPRAGFVQAIILTPTRELALQVSEEIQSFKGNRNFSILTVYGGQSISEQLRRLKKGADIVVGTPGRVIDHLNRHSLSLENISYFILDEADEMLNMGFIDDVEKIFASCKHEKQVLMFSATMPDHILKLAEKYMHDYEIHRVEKQHLTSDLTDQIYFEVNSADRFEALCRILDMENEFYGLVFCRTKKDVDEVSHRLIDRGYDAEALHGDISQYQRERIMDKFKKGRVNILVATDVAARGIDVQNLTHVINFALPQDPESYVHRIGRTGRAGKEGTAVTFVTPSEYRKLLYIKKVARTEIRKEKMPRVKDVIRIKRERIINEINEYMEKEVSKEFLGFADEILREHDAAKTVAALLQYFFEDELDAENYREIREVHSNSGIDLKRRARLFVARGKKQGMGPKSLVNFIKDEAGVDPHLIRDVRIYDDFSFISVPFAEAEIILQTFRKNKRGGRPIVSKAKEKPEHRHQR